jgi:hypothetical protein
MKKGFLINTRNNKDESFHRFRYVGKGSAFTNHIFLLHQLQRFRNTGKLGPCEAIGLLLLVSRCGLTVPQMLFDLGSFGEETLSFFKFGYQIEIVTSCVHHLGVR